MQVIVVVLNKLDCLDDLLANLKRAGVRGGTIIESTGMIKTIDDSDESYLLGSLRLFLENPRPESRTIFFIVEDGQVDLVRKTVDESVGGIDNPNTGIVFWITSYICRWSYKKIKFRLYFFINRNFES